MNDLRKTTGPVRQALKAAVRRALILAGGGDSVQYATRVKAPALSRYASSQEEHQENHCPIDVALDLDLEAGQPVITTLMARAQGYDLHPTEPAIYSDIPWCSKLGAIARQDGLLHGMIGEALADGQINALEAKCIVDEIDRHMDQLRSLRARVEAEGAQGGKVVPVRMAGEARS